MVSDQLKGRTSIGSTLTFHCNVQPAPPQGTTYVWSSSVNSANINSGNSTSPNATILVSVHHPSIGHYYCHVYYNGAQLGLGSISVDVTGELSIEPKYILCMIQSYFIGLQALYTQLD